MNVGEFSRLEKRWVIRRYASEADYAAGRPGEVVGADGQALPAESVIVGNVLLQEGIGEILDLVGGLGTPTAYNDANARIGVGDSNTAESAAHTGLQAASNKAYAAMESGYPQRSAQTLTWRAVFGSAVANFAWNEFTVVNAASDTGKNVNRKVSAQGSKVAGQTWTVDLSLSLS